MKGRPKALLRPKRKHTVELQTTALVALQHVLPSVVDLFKRLIELGYSPKNIFIVGKPYSTISSAAAELRSLGCYVDEPDASGIEARGFSEFFHRSIERFWKTVVGRLPQGIEHLVLLDEGGWLTRYIPDELLAVHRVSAVEHTMYGIISQPAGGYAFPVVLMAASAAKRKFESTVIADALIQRAQVEVRDLLGMRLGVVGVGNLGEALVSRLEAKGARQIICYDVDASKGRQLHAARRVESIAECLLGSDVIWGCTGRNAITAAGPLPHAGGMRYLASCSSGDIEFRAIAQVLLGRSRLRSAPFENARGTIGGTEVVLLNGGFPLNFDRVVEWEPTDLIQLTRELSFASVVQATLMPGDGGADGEVMLDAEVQSLLVERWLAAPETRALFPHWVPHQLDWWERNSRGQRAIGHLSDYVNIQL